MAKRAERKNPPKKDRNYQQLWRIVDGAVRDAFNNHPDYLTKKGMHAARMSINKRVVGAVLGYATEVARGRSEYSSAADTNDGLRRPSFWAKLCCRLRRW